MPGVYFAIANSHFGAHPERKTEHLTKQASDSAAVKKQPYIKFSEKQKVKSFLNQFSLCQHNIIAMCSVSVPEERQQVGNNGQ